MMFMLAKQAEKTWRRIDGFVHAASILHGIEYDDGVLKLASYITQPQCASSIAIESISPLYMSVLVVGASLIHNFLTHHISKSRFALFTIASEV